ncbi:iron-containing alcohol dehydrogenase [Roseibium sp. CAU 1637]|uniref:Iron-containing alcohol dehydrogenase n=1 Tax=Roseibium limicola TaxID=2816037 RepID=A0A939J8C2_9HYPH|nr:iron-containing alcohol dehydrogenase [Roseibium limicola]MBO0347047.1 iron-containing alcohol dehydrogenase [Roseibium limicola]
MADLINYLTSIRFGFGSAGDLSSELEAQGIRCPLFVTDKGIVAAGLLKRTVATNGITSPIVFDETPPNPTDTAAAAALRVYRDRNCDGIVALGGGSPIDLAKAVALMVHHHEPLVRYAVIEGGLARIVHEFPPLIAIPTTAGTGSEVGRGAIISFKDGRKLGLISPKMIPTVAICDPELTLGLPPLQTAATGMDALTHCIETYLSPRFNPTAEAIALDGLRRAAHNIEIAFRDGTNRQARQEMMIAALHGGMTFQKGLGSVHALSHPLGGLKSVSLHHGTLNAVLLPIVLRLCEGAAPEKSAVLREVLGVAPGASLANYVSDLNKKLELPSTLGELGVSLDVVPAIAEAAMLDHSHASNVRPMSLHEYRAILTEAITGKPVF